MTRSGTPALALSWMILGEWRAHPARVVLATLAIAVGVALGFAVHLINGSALDAFGQAVRTVNGAADLQVRAAGPGRVRRAPLPAHRDAARVADASPVVSVTARTARRGSRFTLLGLDVLRAGMVTPSLVGQAAAGGSAPGAGQLDERALFLSRAALAAAGARIGQEIAVTANGRTVPLKVAGVLSGVARRPPHRHDRHRRGAMALRPPGAARPHRPEARRG
jgi:putative ABC transport system permease protein